MKFNCTGYALFVSTLSCFLIVITNGQKSKPPRYSLDNMPKTSFSCRDKILGGYYADPETQCQMFHVCVKVAGVGIQDYRFLCPNGTAFNQEAQVCVDFGDVNCEDDTLFYGSGNFDLYRLGTGFESKRAPFADEEEADFHLQRAETSDARRSKQFIVNQSTRSEHPSIQKQHNGFNNNQKVATATASLRTEAPVTFRASPSSYYTPTTTISTTTTSSYNDFVRKNSNNDFYSHNNEEIFKSSQTGNFFNNRNSGKEDHDDYQSSSSTSTTTSTTLRPRPRPRNRGHIKARVTAEPYIASTVNSNNFYSSQQATTPKSRPSPPQITQPNVSVNNRGSAYNEYDRYSNKLSTSKANVEKTSTHLFPTSSPDYQKFNNFGANSVAPNKQVFAQSSTAAPFRAQSTTPYPSFNSIFNTTLPASSPAPFQKASFSYNTNNNQQSFSSSSTSTTTTTTFRPPTPFQVNNLNEQSRETRFYNANYETTGAPVHPTFQSRFAQRQSTDIPLKDIKPSTYNPGNFHRFASTASPSAPAASSSAAPEFQPRRFQPNPAHFEPTKLAPVTNSAQNVPTAPQQVQSRNNFDAQYHARQLAIAQITITTQAPEPTNRQNTPIYNRAPSGRAGSRYTPDYVDVTTNSPSSQPSEQPKSQEYRSQVVQNQHQQVQRVQNYQQDPFQTPSSAKKFSTLVPKEHLYNPTTFKPDIFNVKKTYGPFEINKQKPQPQPIVVAPVPQQQQINVRVSPAPSNTNSNQNTNNGNYNRFEIPQQQHFRSTVITTTSTTPRPLADDEEDDGQYRPEIYEKDLYKNKLKAKLRSKQNKHFNYYQTTTNKPSNNNNNNNNDEDELFNTAHSQNIAASGNELRAERARQVAASVNKLQEVKSTTKASPTKNKKKDEEKDVSYDYQYYDFGNEQNSYDELIEEFGRTKVKSKN